MLNLALLNLAISVLICCTSVVENHAHGLTPHPHASLNALLNHFWFPQKVVGIAQLVNKKGGAFKRSDEKLFQAFAVYCGLSISAVSMYDHVNTVASKYTVRVGHLTSLAKI